MTKAIITLILLLMLAYYVGYRHGNSNGYKQAIKGA